LVVVEQRHALQAGGHFLQLCHGFSGCAACGFDGRIHLRQRLCAVHEILCSHRAECCNGCSEADGQFGAYVGQRIGCGAQLAANFAQRFVQLFGVGAKYDT